MMDREVLITCLEVDGFLGTSDHDYIECGQTKDSLNQKYIYLVFQKG